MNLKLFPMLLTLGFASAQAQFLPAGPGQKMVGTICKGCHSVARVSSGYSPQGWDTVLRMMTNHGLHLSGEQLTEIRDYLVKNFPEQAKPPANIVPGPVQVKIQAWPVPTPGSRPHDPLATRDGTLWYTGQMAGVLGRLDPKTGQIKEFPLQPEHSGPHGLVEDSEGNIWYTGNAAALIGKLDPKTGINTVYPMPDAAVRDPHTLIFDKSGILWFTAQNANRLGRLDPKTGEIKLLKPPSEDSRPYGMAVDSRGMIFYVAFGTNKVGRIDPQTLAIREYSLPNAATRPRRITISSDDLIWYTDYSRGYLGQLNAQTGQVKEWPSPGGPKSQPYGMSSIKDVIWYSESGTKPGTVVRFDPKTEKFQTWAIPGGGDIVRNTSVTADGAFVLANSLSNEVTLVTPLP